MAFQDFDLIQERRNQVRQQRLKKRITIAVVSLCVILLLVAAAFCAVLYKNRMDENNTVKEKDATPTSTAKKASPEKHHSPPKPDSDSPESKPSPASPAPKATPAAPGPAPGSEPALAPGPAPGVPLADTVIKAICAKTDYPEACESALKANASASEPKELIKATISAANESIDKALTAVTDVKSDDPFKKAALTNCLTLLNDSKDELNTSVSSIDGKDMEKLKPELNNWLSAVMSYQQTCIDGLPDGEEKNTVQTALDIVKQQTSNSLAMVSQASSVPGANINRRLLSKKSLLHPSGEDSFPTWADQELRRNLKADLPTQSPNATVAKNGSGNFTSISDALAAIPQSYEGRYYIYVKEGTYEENVVVTKRMVNVTIYGVGSQKSVVTGSKNIIDGIPTFQTATFVAEGEGFMAQSLGFKNTAGAEKHEAVALRVKSDRSIFLNCRMEGYQSTIFAQTHRQFYRSCYITGTIDIVFGDAAAVFQNCDFYLRKPLENQQNVVVSQYRVDKHETTGTVLQNCHILADDKLEPEKAKFKSYLGRSMKNYSRIIVIESEIGDAIDPEGWIISQGDIGINTGFYAEYGNKGPGAEVSGRVKWEGLKSSISKDEAVNFTVGPFLQGESWLKGGNVPVRFGLFN